MNDLTDGTIGAPINQDELGNYQTNAPVWTGTSSDGTGDGFDCGSWETLDSSAREGRANTATAAGQDPGGNPVSDTDNESVSLPRAAQLRVTKTGVFNDDITADGVAQAGETISYSIQVTNSGNVTVSSITVSDPLIATITCPTSGNATIASLSVGASETCTGSYAVTQDDIDAGHRDNTATVDSDETGPVHASETVELPSGS